MDSPRELNVSRNMDPVPKKEFGSVPESKPSISIRNSRRFLASNTSQAISQKQNSSRADSTTDPAPRLVGTLTTASHAIRTNDDETRLRSNT